MGRLSSTDNMKVMLKSITLLAVVCIATLAAAEGTGGCNTAAGWNDRHCDTWTQAPAGATCCGKSGIGAQVNSVTGAAYGNALINGRWHPLNGMLCHGSSDALCTYGTVNQAVTSVSSGTASRVHVLPGWCREWRHQNTGESMRIRGVQTFFSGSHVTRANCVSNCTADPECHQAVFEESGPWGPGCWLGNRTSDVRPTGSRPCTGRSVPCVDFCFNKDGWDRIASDPTAAPIDPPTQTPTEAPTPLPTRTPTESPTTLPPTSDEPTFSPTSTPTESPTQQPTRTPTELPTIPARMNEGQQCYHACHQNGRCSFCGSEGYCCRNSGWGSQSGGCWNTFQNSFQHVCQYHSSSGVVQLVETEETTDALLADSLFDLSE